MGGGAGSNGPKRIFQMSLLEELQRARTEEDVKDAYIKALGLKSVFKGLVDIQPLKSGLKRRKPPLPRC